MGRAPARRAALYLQEIPTGLTIAVNPNRSFVSASLIKLPVMAASYSLWERQPRHKTAAARCWTEEMITVSHNGHTNPLIDMLGGERPVVRFCASRGWPNYQLRHALRPRRGQKPNVCTAREVGEFLVALDRRRLVSPAADEEMWQVLRRSRMRFRIPEGLPDDVPGLEVGNKTGTLGHVLHDAALVRTPRTRYALCILTSGYRSETEGNRFCRRVSRLVFDALHGPVTPPHSIARNETRPAQ
jgi:beta-lactamase class A